MELEEAEDRGGLAGVERRFWAAVLVGTYRWRFHAGKHGPPDLGWLGVKCVR